MKLLVITEVPDPLTDHEGGNLACPIGELFLVDRDRPPMPLEHFHASLALAMRTPVFQLGELLIVDDDGRELLGSQRKPSKWHVGTSSFELKDLKLAIEFAQALMPTIAESTT